MKNKIRLIILSGMVFVFAIAISASTIVSPALNVLAKENPVIKSGLVYSDIYFSEQDFMKCLGISSVSEVKVSALPSPSDGTLKLGTLSVTEGQTINSGYLSMLRFVPASDQVVSANCNFEYNGRTIPCVIRLLNSVNYAPTFADCDDSINTYRNVSFYGSLRASDPEGDELSVQVISYPSRGVLTLTDASHGNFKYEPVQNFVGEDKFTVVVRDMYGNYSETQTVSINVGKNNTVFTDTTGHWCENAAICLYEKGIADATRYQNGLVFCPEDSVSREAFITMVMKTLDIDTLTDTETSFADNSEIDVRYRPYVATAQRMGYINGSDSDGKVYFSPKSCITKSEAAVVINNILGLGEGVEVSAFADDVAIPTWARGAVYALTSAGIFSGDGEGVIAPSAILSRAQTVQMLYNIIDK